MRRELCLCEQVAQVKQQVATLQTKVFVVMHHREEWLTTATARWAQMTLPFCEIRIRGKQDEPLVTEGFVETNRTTLLLYPSEHAQVLDQNYVTGLKAPVNLIVPDGSWRQASKAARREPALENLPQVMLPEMGPTGYLLRREPKEGGLATFEAIIRALSCLEPKANVTPLDRLFREMVRRTLNSRVGILKS